MNSDQFIAFRLRSIATFQPGIEPSNRRRAAVAELGLGRTRFYRLHSHYHAGATLGHPAEDEAI